MATLSSPQEQTRSEEWTIQVESLDMKVLVVVRLVLRLLCMVVIADVIRLDSVSKLLV